MKAIHWITKKFKKVGILALFFTICFVYIFIVINLFLKTYSIDNYGISKVIVGSLFAPSIAKDLVLNRAIANLTRLE